MRTKPLALAFAVFLGGLFCRGSVRAAAGELIVELGNSTGVTLVGAIQRWDRDGKARVPADAAAKIDNPRVDARAEAGPNGRWGFGNLAGGYYDLVILATGRIRVEGVRYPPLREFDPFLPPNAPPPDDETRDWIAQDIGKARHYENKVSPLFWAGGDKQVRILVQLVRDQPTSFDADFGAPVATVRHEVWQYTNNYGGWVKDRRTEVLDRILMPRSEFRLWTWVWEPKLGGIEVGKNPITMSYKLPTSFDPRTARGWFRN
jgi:hypothetical protein